MVSSIILFSIILVIGLASRIPKTQLTDGLILVDLMELMVFYTILKLGLFPATLFIFLVNWAPLIKVKIESPLQTLTRTVAIVIGVIVFYILLVFGYANAAAVFGGIVTATVIWGIISIYVVRDMQYLILTILRCFIYYQVLIKEFLIKIPL